MIKLHIGYQMYLYFVYLSTWSGNIDGVIYRSDHLEEVAEYVLEVRQRIFHWFPLNE